VSRENNNNFACLFKIDEEYAQMCRFITFGWKKKKKNQDKTKY